MNQRESRASGRKMKVRSTATFSSPTVRILVCLTAATGILCLVTLPLPSHGEKKTPPRSISALTLNERMNLPENTQVTLKSGHATTLGVLRTEHRARMESFAKAAELGRALAARLKASANSAVATSKGTVTPSAGAMQRSAVASPPIPQQKPGALAGRTQAEAPPGGKAGSATTVKTAIAAAGPNAMSLPKTLAPMPDLTSKSPYGILPKDYRDFCQAAQASACIYLPPDTSFFAGQYTGVKNTPFVAASDPLIMDPGVCAYAGGSLDGEYGCLFNYPLGEVTNFIPNAPISSNASCDPATHYVVDPKGAVQVTVSAPQFTNLGAFTTPQQPITCAVQVWLTE